MSWNSFSLIEVIEQKQDQGFFITRNIVSFSRRITPPNSWETDGGHSEYIDILTPWVFLDSDASRIDLNIVDFTEAAGGSRLNMIFRRKEIVGDSGDPKTLRVHFEVFIHDALVHAVNVSGIIVGNRPVSELKDASIL